MRHDDQVVMRAHVPLALALALGGCVPSSAPPDTGGDVDLRDAGAPPVADGLDLLFMIDDSCPLAEEQANLIIELPRLLGALASGDLDGDGTLDMAPVGSLHVGIVTSDLGAGPYEGVPTCGPGLGDDGILRARSRVTSAPCRESYPSGVLAFHGARDEVAELASAVSCVANIGTGGCGFEQQLESALKALTPSQAYEWTAPGYVPPRFVSSDGTPDLESGQGDRANRGFLRAGSALAVMLVTDEDDCSVRDYGLYVTADPRFQATPLNLRCWRFGAPELGVLQPVERYVEGFLGLRRDPRLLAFSALVGLPPQLEGRPDEAPDFDAIAADPNMTLRENAMGTNSEPACSTVNGVAYAPRRIVQVARGLHARGAHVSVSSLCSVSFELATDALLWDVAQMFPLRGADGEP